MANNLYSFAITSIAILLVFVAFVSTSINAKEYPNVSDEELTQILSEISHQTNKNLPRQIDKHTRMDSTGVGPGRKITYLYTLTNLQSRNTEPNEIKKLLREQLVNSVCTSPEMETLLNLGVEVAYRYHGKNGGYITELAVTWRDCDL